MIKVKHPETGEELEFKTKKEILEYFELKCSYAFFSKKSKEIGIQEALDNIYSKLIRVKHPETGEELIFKNQSDLFKYFKLGCKISSFNIKIKDIGVQEALNHFYSKLIRIKHPDTGEELTFKSKTEIVGYFDLEITYNNFNMKCNKIGAQEALNYYLDKESKFIKVKNPETDEELKFNTRKEIVDYFSLRISHNAFNIKSNKIGIQEALNYYYLKNKSNIVKDPDTGEELIFKNPKEIWKYFNMECSYNTFLNMSNKIGINEAIKKIKPRKTINFRNLEFKTYKEFKKYFKLNSFNSSFIKKYDYLTIEEIVIMLKLKQGYIFVDSSYDDFYFQEISEFAKEKGLSEEYVKQKLNEGFTSKDFK